MKLLPLPCPSHRPPPVLRRCRPTAGAFRLETLESRMLLASGDLTPNAVGSWQAAIVNQRDVSLRLDTTTSSHTLVLQGGTDGHGTLTLNTDLLGADINRITADHLSQLVLTGSHAFELIQLDHIIQADLGHVALSLGLYAASVDHLVVNTPNLFAVLQGNSTTLRSDLFDNALVLTNTSDLLLSSSHPATTLSVVATSSGSGLSIDFSAASLNLVGFTQAPRYVAPPPVNLLTSIMPVASTSVVSTPPATVQQPVAIPATVIASVPAAPELTPILNPTVSPVATAATSPNLELLPAMAASVFPSSFPALSGEPVAGPSSEVAKLPPTVSIEHDAPVPPSVVSATAAPNTLHEDPAALPGTAMTIQAALPAEVSARLAEKLLALSNSASPAGSDFASLITQAIRVAQAAAVGQELSVSSATSSIDIPSGEAAAAGAPLSSTDVEASTKTAAAGRSTAAQPVPTHGASAADLGGTFISSSPLADPSSGGEARPLTTLHGDSTPLTAADLEHWAAATRVTTRRTVLRDIPLDSGAATGHEFMPLASTRHVSPDEVPAASRSNAPMEFWRSQNARVELASHLWPYHRTVAATEFKAYLVDHLLAEFTPGERSVLLADPFRARSAPFALV